MRPPGRGFGGGFGSGLRTGRRGGLEVTENVRLRDPGRPCRSPRWRRGRVRARRRCAARPAPSAASVAVPSAAVAGPCGPPAAICASGPERAASSRAAPVAGRVDAGDELLAEARLPLGEHDLGQGAALRGGHLEHHLVGLELDQHVSALDPVAGPEVPGEELRVRYRFGEVGDPHVYEHERTPRRCRAGSPAEDGPRCLRGGASPQYSPIFVVLEKFRIFRDGPKNSPSFSGLGAETAL